MNILDGKKLKDKILSDLKNKISNEKAKIKLAIIYVGHDDSSEIYIKNKKLACEYVGIEAMLYTIDEQASDEEVISLITKLNNDTNINGILLQSPIPNTMDFNKCSNTIDPKKDVDGFTPLNVYANYSNISGLKPCTAKGIIKLLEYYNIPLEGSNIVIIGRGNIVGKPLAIALKNKNATVTVVHTKTKNIKDICKQADILISAAGCNHLVTNEYVKNNAVVVDVGISRINGKLTGDVDYDSVSPKCSYITPVPGGVGPMTVAMLLENTYEAYKLQK